MKKNTIITTVLFLLTCLYAQAQTAGDALRYSNWQYGGTARYVGTGGALGALGGDYSAIISNPASIGSYRRSEFTLTPGVYISGTNSDFDGTVFKEKKAKVNLNNAAVVFATTSPHRWKSASFAIGYNRLADFSQRFNYSGVTQGSIADYFLDLAQGLSLDQLGNYDSGLAFDTDLIYRPDADNDPTYYENDIFPNDATEKFQTVNRSGSMGEINLAFGGNFDHKLYLGGSLGIPILNYNESKTYTETDVDESIRYFNAVTYREGLNTSGAGINLKIGAIYRASQALRLGAAVHTPSWLSLTDNYVSSMEYDITYGQAEDGTGGTATLNTAESPEGFFEYRQKTPWRVILDAGYIIKKRGFVSAELEWLNYAGNAYNFNSEFSTPDDLAFEQAINDDILSQFGSALNVKLGAEFVIKKLFRLRGGYALYGTPYFDEERAFDKSQASLGLGYRKDNFFLDLAYAKRFGQAYYAPYIQAASSQNPVVDNRLSSDYIVVTAGFKFGGGNRE